jgi:hypothetical protein
MYDEWIGWAFGVHWLAFFLQSNLLRAGSIGAARASEKPMARLP